MRNNGGVSKQKIALVFGGAILSLAVLVFVASRIVGRNASGQPAGMLSAFLPNQYDLQPSK